MFPSLARVSRRMPRRAPVLMAAALALGVGLVGCGGGGSQAFDAPAAAPSAQPELPEAPAQPVALGEIVRPGAHTPAPVSRALTRTSKVVVIGFVLGGVADDERVAAAIRTARGKGASRAGVRYFTFRIGEDTASFGDLADMLQVEGTPAVAVIGRDRKLANLFTGLIDVDILRQAVQSAKETQPAVVDAVSAEGAEVATRAITGNPAGVALGKRIDAAYAEVPGMRLEGTYSAPGQDPVQMTLSARMSKGSVALAYLKGTASGVQLEVVAGGGRSALRVGGDGSCWVGREALDGVVETPDASLVRLVAGGKVGAPRRVAGRIELPVTFPEASLVYVVDPSTSRILAMRGDGQDLRVQVLESAPEIPRTEPRCASTEEGIAPLVEAATRRP